MTRKARHLVAHDAIPIFLYADESPCQRSICCHILWWLSPQVQTSEPSLSEIRDELRNVLSSSRFRQSPRLAKLLRYICTSALTADSDPITEYTIAVDVLGKTQDFKEGKDAIVRVATALLERETLSGAEIKRIMGSGS